MTEQQTSLILLIKSALTGEPYRLPANTDLTAVFQVAKHHGVDVMAYYGGLLCGVDKNHPVMQEEMMRVYSSISVSGTQLSAIRKIKDALEAHGIDHMPLKGVHLKKLYPHPEMRRMGDADILIDCSKYETVRGFMQEFGYTEKYESNHEIVWAKKAVTIEFHKRLIPSYNKDYYQYFGDGWKLAKPLAGYTSRFCMDPEDEMIYLFTHFAKHYRDSGIGIRHFVDLWVYQKHNPNMDQSYIRKELDKLQLLEFYDNIMRTLRVWFENYPQDEKAEYITQFIFTSGEFGHSHFSNLSSALKYAKNGQSELTIKRRRALHTLFPGYAEMCNKYKVLCKWPVLLPVMWLVRICQKVFIKKRVRLFIDRQQQVNIGEISEYQKSLNFVGLDFHFKE